MVILHIDITFDDYNTSVLNQRNTAGYMQSVGQDAPFTSQNLHANNFTPTNQLPQLQHANSADTAPYFYLRDNPQCSSALNTTNRFT